MSFQQFLNIAGTQNILTLLTAMMALFRFNSRQLYIKLLGLYFLLFFLYERVGGYLYHVKINPNYASSVGNIIGFPLIAWVYYLTTGKRHRNRYVILIFVYVIFGLVNLLFIQRENINSYTFVFRSVCTLIFALYYFYWLLKELPTSQLQKLPMFWINSAFMVFASGTLFLYVFTAYLVNVMNNDLLIYWSFHNILGIIEILMIIVALWMDLRNIKSPSLSP